jgi:molybdate transport system regulatory protein
MRSARVRGADRRTRPRIAPKLKVWVVFGDRVKFGDGRARLLELVDELGSLRRAVSRVGMSYRAAWGYFRELERASGVKLIEPVPGAGPRGGTRLTAEGRAVVTRFRRFQAGLDAGARRTFARAFRPR